MTSSQIDYRAYMASDEWKEKRAAALRRSSRRTRSFSPACEMCGRFGTRHKNRAEGRDHQYRVDNSNGLQVHHAHYRNLGNEEPNDLIVLCTDACWLGAWPDQGPYPPRMGCHERAHDNTAYRLLVSQIASGR